MTKQGYKRFAIAITALFISLITFEVISDAVFGITLNKYFGVISTTTVFVLSMTLALLYYTKGEGAEEEYAKYKLYGFLLLIAFMYPIVFFAFFFASQT